MRLRNNDVPVHSNIGILPMKGNQATEKRLQFMVAATPHNLGPDWQDWGSGWREGSRETEKDRQRGRGHVSAPSKPILGTGPHMYIGTVT